MVLDLQQKLAVRERELELLLAIDDLRDAITESDSPNIIYQKLLDLLISKFDADAGGMVVTAENTTNIQVIITKSLPKTSIESICKPLIEGTQTNNIQTISIEGWNHAIGLNIILDNEPLGAIILLRKNEANPFNEATLSVLKTAIRQIDSMIIQVRRIWKLTVRKRELDTIYQLDQLRDNSSDETTLVNGFVQTVVKQFQADLCLVILSHIDSGDFITRGMVDKIGLSPDQLKEINTVIKKITGITNIRSFKEDVYLIASPFIINDMHLGALVVGRKTSYTDDDQRLLLAMSSQMDSAVVYSRVIQQLAQRNKELEIIYNIDQIRDSDIDFDAMLQAVLGELCKAINAEMGYILLYNEEKEDQLEIKSSSEEGVMTSPAYYEAIHTISRQALKGAQMLHENERGGEVHSIIAVPLILREKIIGVFGGVNSKNQRGFNAEDQRMLHAIVSQTDTAVFERMEQRRVRQVLGRSVDPKVLDHLLEHANAASVLQGERMNVSVLFADLRGSTEWSERTEPDALALSLNQYLGRMTDVIFKYGGTLDKFVGDEVIGLFGAPLPMEDHGQKCAVAAMEMQEVMDELIKDLKSKGYELPPMGVGVSTGEAICGEFGTAQRTDYTAMGRMMNLGARLCSEAKGGEVVISENTYNTIKDKSQVELLDNVIAKGIGKVNAYKLITLNIDD